MTARFPIPHPLRPLTLAVISTLVPVLTHSLLHAQTAALVSETERATVRSQENLLHAQTLIRRALQLSAEGKQKEAFEEASAALEIAPSGSSANSVRGGIISGYTSVALAYSRKLIRDGVYTDTVAAANGIVDSKGRPLSAEGVAKSVLDPSVNPGCLAAKQLLSDLEQPDLLKKTVTPKFAAQRDEVTRLLNEAQGLAASGRNELALRRYESVLAIDPYNSAARKGMEAVNNSKIKYADEAYNETRSHMLWQVEKIWERHPRKQRGGRIAESLGKLQDIKNTDQIREKLNQIILDKVEIPELPLSDALVYVKQKAKSADPEKKGVNIFLKMGAKSQNQTNSLITSSNQQTLPTVSTSTSTPSTADEPIINLSLNHIPLKETLDYIAKMSGMKLKIESDAVNVVPETQSVDSLEKAEWPISPNFLPSKTIGGSPAALPGYSLGTPDKKTIKMDAKEFLMEKGVQFPDGPNGEKSSAVYIPNGSRLIVVNTKDNLDTVNSIVESASVSAPSQVEINTKFLEINQNNLQELGFDWLLGPFSVGGGVYGSGGGVPGAGAATPFGNPMSGGAPMSPVGSLRSGDQAISGSTIDSLLGGQVANGGAVAPGIFSIAGIFTEAQFQLVIRALNQKKGIDLMAAPKVTAKNGAKATVKVAQEFIYPKTYQAPQFQQANNSGGTGGVVVVNPARQSPPTITPSFPSEWAKENIGVELDVTPQIGNDGYFVDLDLKPKVIDFDGFINYGSPISAIRYTPGVTAEYGPGLYPNSSVLTTNTIQQPVFSFREVNTYVTVGDNQTIAIGGLIREDIIKVQDKVPLLGDVPLAGRLFRSEVDQKVKKNLIIFVTPRILDADGQPRRGEVEEPEVVTPLGLPQDIPLPTNSISRGK